MSTFKEKVSHALSAAFSLVAGERISTHKFYAEEHFNAGHDYVRSGKKSEDGSDLYKRRQLIDPYGVTKWSEAEQVRGTRGKYAVYDYRRPLNIHNYVVEEKTRRTPVTIPATGRSLFTRDEAVAILQRREAQYRKDYSLSARKQPSPRKLIGNVAPAANKAAAGPA